MSRPYHQVRRSKLSETAKETKASLPSILHALPNIDPAQSSLIRLSDLPALDPTKCPKYTTFDTQTASNPIQGVRVNVMDTDTLDVAFSLSQPALRPPENSHAAQLSNNRVAVLNLASDTTPGGGWLSGALAQEESICYRSSLHLSLHKRYYPLPADGAIYTPSVVVIRDSWGSGHKLLTTNPKYLLVVSVISVAAIRRPKIGKSRQADDENTDVSRDLRNSDSIPEREVFARPTDRTLTKNKIRLSLRIAASQGHRRLVLGALGCGAFRNPNGEVASCWKEVLRETEFRGWWETVVFAVLDKGSDGDNGTRDREGNYMRFKDELDGLVV